MKLFIILSIITTSLFSNQYTILKNKFCSIFIEQNNYIVEGKCNNWEIDKIIYNTKKEFILDTIIENQPSVTAIYDNNKLGQIDYCYSNCIQNYNSNNNTSKNRVYLYKIKNNDIFRYKELFDFPVLKSINLNYDELMFRGIVFDLKINNSFNHYLIIQKPLYDEMDNHLNNLFKIKKLLKDKKIVYNIQKLNNYKKYKSNNLLNY